MLDTSEMAAALMALKVQMSAAGLLPSVGTSRRLDYLLARLTPDEFLCLRTLPAFWALLALWEMPVDGLDATALQDDEQVADTSDEHENDVADVPTSALHAVQDAQPSAVIVETSLLPHPHTPIGDARLGGRYDKLIIRLCRSAARAAGAPITIERLEDILSLSEESLLKFEGVGKTYRDDWRQLKALYTQASGELPPAQPEAATIREPCHDVRDDMLLNLTQLDSSELKAIAKLERALGSADIRTILSFDTSEHREVGLLGNRSMSRLLQVRSRLMDELQRITEGTLDYRVAPSSLITAQAQSFESVAALGRFVLDRVDSYLSGLDEKSQLIFQYRWGFVDERMTLSEIGNKFGVTRERIRQLESKINKKLDGYLALDTDEVWEAAKKLPRDELCLQMSDLCDCFREQVHFHEFLTFVSHSRMASPLSSALPSLGILDDYFAQHGTAIEQHVALRQLQHLLGGDEKDAYDALHYLQSQGQVALTSGQVRPLCLGKHEAAAAVLSEHPNGLPWLDIARLANSRGISRSPFSEQVSGPAIQDSPLMYVAGKGVYRHTRFVDFAVVDNTTIFDALHAYFASVAREVSHLSEAYGDSPVLREYDYYIVRYVVKMHGEAHGIYFNGKSQTDSISLDSEFGLYSQKSVILQAMQRELAPMTKSEVAQLLKSRSLAHASFYIHEMTLANQIVQVDRMLYTTPELAYENIDLDAMRQAIESVLRRHDKPVESSVIQAELNMRQGETYSKFFYRSLARYFAQLQHWHRSHVLFGLQPISFASLTEAIDTLCGPDASMELNVATLRQHIAITEEAAKVSINNWKAAKARLVPGASIYELEEEVESD